MDVKTYMVDPTSGMCIIPRGHLEGQEYEMVLVEDFDRVTAERDALQQLLNARDEKVDRLRVELESMNETFGMQEDKIDTLRAQLAEAHELLREVHGGMWPSNPLTIKIGSHLSASAEPSAMAERIKSAACHGCASKPCMCKEPSAPAEIDERAEITLEQVLRAYEYAERHPHRYLRGTTNWCAAVAHSLNKKARAALERKS